MRVVIEANESAASQVVAKRIERLVRRKPDCVLGLATGSTPLQTYRHLIRMHLEEGLDFSKVTTFNLDEYVGLSAQHPQSYRHFMNANLFSQININLDQTFVPDGLATDFEKTSSDYEQAIERRGGIDLQLLGIGTDGHIGFNEPGSSLAGRTRVKSLLHQTLNDNARFFGSPEKVPKLAITMGIGTILDARECVLMAMGSHKASAIKATIEGPLTAQVTASALQLHPRAMVVVDELAASQLERKQDYLRAEQAQQDIERQSTGSAAIPSTHIQSQSIQQIRHQQ